MNRVARLVTSAWSGTLALAFVALVSVGAQAPGPAVAPAAGVKFPQLSETDAREWLTYLSSDQLQGRQIFTEGYGMAAAYVAERLRQWGVKPLGDDGTYFQVIRQRSYRVARNSSVTIEANGVSRTFRHGDHVTFAADAGGKQTLTFQGVQFAGYAQVPGVGAPRSALESAPIRGSFAVFVPGAPGAAAAGGSRANRALNARSTYLVETLGAAAAAGFAAAPAPSGVAATTSPSSAGGTAAESGRGPAGADRGRTPPRPDLVTSGDVTRNKPPIFTADEEFFDFLFRGAGSSFADVRAKAAAGEPIDTSSLAGVTVTISIDNAYQVMTTQFTENVVGLIEGTDRNLRDTYVFFGAHLDHVGYSSGDEPRGRINVPLTEDRIWNGADDDGSGSTAVLAIAKAFATGPKPKRSVVVVWHAGEEEGLIGSEFMAEHPVVPLDKIQAVLNIDMIGRNRDDKASEANTVYVIGADRISTDLHNLLVGANEDLPRPLTLDYEFNDAADPNSFYTRSDHYSYASKGIPIAFFFTGTHPDYHANTDSVDKIIFPKLVRVAQMVYESGFAVANSDRVLVRDNLGPRSGRGFQGRLSR